MVRYSSNYFAGPSPGFQYNKTYPLTRPTGTVKGMRYRIAVISDLDEASKVPDKSNLWRSYYKKGYLTYDSDRLVSFDNVSIMAQWISRSCFTKRLMQSVNLKKLW